MKTGEDKYKPVLSVRLSKEIIEKLDKCLELKKKDMEQFRVTYKRSDLLEDMINDFYYNAMSDTLDPDISDRLDQAILEKLRQILRHTNINEYLEMIVMNSLIIKKQLDILLRISNLENLEDCKAEYISQGFDEREAQAKTEQYMDCILDEDEFWTDMITRKVLSMMVEGNKKEK